MAKPKEYQVYCVPEPPPVIRMMQHVLVAADIVDMIERRSGEKIEVLDPRMLEMAYHDMFDANGHSARIRRDDALRSAWAIYRHLKERGLILDGTT